MICVRLRLQLGRDLVLSRTGKIDPSELAKGSERPWVTRVCDELLALKP